jgi:hypothetical protein
VLADRAVELEGGRTFTPPGDEVRAEWTAQQVRDLVEPARVTALEKLDEGRQAIAIATEWVRLRLADTTRTDGDRPP